MAARHVTDPATRLPDFGNSPPSLAQKIEGATADYDSAGGFGGLRNHKSF